LVVADEKKKRGTYFFRGEPVGKGADVAEALHDYLGESKKVGAPLQSIHERPTVPPPPNYEDTLQGTGARAKAGGKTLFDEFFGHVPLEIISYDQRGSPVAAQLSETEKQLIQQRIKDPLLVKEFSNPRNADSARRFVEAVRWETRMVEKLEQHGFPRGVPTPHAFLPSTQIPRGKTTFIDRFRALEGLAWEDSRNRVWRDPRELRKMRDEGLARILAHYFDEDTVKAFHGLPGHAKEEVLEALKRYEETRHSLHEKGFDKNLPVTEGLSEALDVRPTPLSEQLPELDRQLETLYKMRHKPREEIERYATYARKIARRE